MTRCLQLQSHCLLEISVFEIFKLKESDNRKWKCGSWCFLYADCLIVLHSLFLISTVFNKFDYIYDVVFFHSRKKLVLICYMIFLLGNYLNSLNEIQKLNTVTLKTTFTQLCFLCFEIRGKIMCKRLYLK